MLTVGEALGRPTRPGGHTSQPIFKQNGSNDVIPRVDVPFAVKIESFSNA